MFNGIIVPHRGTMNKVTQTKKPIPVKQGLYKIPASENEEAALIGCYCPSCGETFFPKRDICQNCQSVNLEEITLSRRGKIYSFTIVMQRPATYYQGIVPYSFGWVELPEGLRIETLFTECDLDDLFLGMEVEMVLDRLHEEKDNQVVCHKFRPIQAKENSATGDTMGQ